MKKPTKTHITTLLTTAAAAITASFGLLPAVVLAAKERNQNLFGMELESCSTEGMAMTGITGSGHCVHFDELHHDEISKTLCVDIPSFSDAYYDDDDTPTSLGFQPDFFKVTGQPMTLNDMPCMGNATVNCPVKHYCINEDVFASYVDYVGGCKKIGRILCQSTNAEALATYENQLEEAQEKGASSNKIEKIKAALECLKYKCWL